MGDGEVVMLISRTLLLLWMQQRNAAAGRLSDDVVNRGSARRPPTLVEALICAIGSKGELQVSLEVATRARRIATQPWETSTSWGYDLHTERQATNYGG